MWVPQLNSTRQRRVCDGGCAIYLAYDGRRVSAQEFHDPVSRRDKRTRQFGRWRLADDDQQHHLVRFDSGELIGFVANSSVVSENNPAFSGDASQPLVIRAIGGEVIAVVSDV